MLGKKPNLECLEDLLLPVRTNTWVPAGLQNMMAPRACSPGPASPTLPHTKAYVHPIRKHSQTFLGLNES